MAGNVKLMTAAGGGVILDTATTTATDVTVKVPAVNGDVVLTNVAGTVALAATGANIITASTNGSERMRIDSSGNVLVGTTSSTGKLSVTGVDSTSSNYALNTRNSGNNQLLSIRNDGYANFGTQATAPYNFGVSTATKAMYMDSGGGLGYNSSIRASKTNITPSPSANWLKDLDIVTFNYRKRDEEGNYTEEAENELRWGVVAEDAELVAKDFCSYDSNGVLDGFNYDRLIPVLIKAIQELKAELDATKAEVAALKGAA